MITRLYVNNFRCLVAFEAKLNSFGVLCGPNGSGKSSVFDAIRLLRNLTTGEGVLGENGEYDIPRLELTTWLGSSIQEFELGLFKNGQQFEYVVHLEQRPGFAKPRIVEERATCDGHVLLEREKEGGASFRKADGSQGIFPFEWPQAMLALGMPPGIDERLRVLQEAMANLLILRPDPRAMERESKGEARHPDLSMTNLTSWYRSLYQDQEWSDVLRNALKEVWPDFRFFNLKEVGENAKVLQLRFESGGDKPFLLDFDNLSDGERALVALYMVRATLETTAVRTVLIDEPDNFVGLPEMQPWVLSMRELLDDEHQLIMISHHPEILASSGQENGHYLWRDNHTAPTRIGPLQVPAGITPGEAIARGWVRG